jgi:4'-phosphopantetheinyl transferase EntD
MPEASVFLGALRDQLPPDIALGSDDPRLPPVGLMPGEAIGGMVPKRLAEFAAGRRAARAAIVQAGMVPAAIPHGPDRAPIWPEGVTGSISHCADLCIALAGRSMNWAGLGVDIEPEHDLEAALWPEILRPEERVWLDSLAPSDRGVMALAIFVAKEAVYKAQYGISRTLFGFDALAISLTGAGYAATFAHDVPRMARGSRLWGHLIHAGGYVAAVCPIYHDWLEEPQRMTV